MQCAYLHCAYFKPSKSQNTNLKLFYQTASIFGSFMTSLPGKYSETHDKTKQKSTTVDVVTSVVISGGNQKCYFRHKCKMKTVCGVAGSRSIIFLKEKKASGTNSK